MVFIGIKSKQYMREIFKFIILLIIFTLVGCNKIYFDSKQLSEQKQVNFINRKLGASLGRSSLNRLARNTTIEIVREGYLTGGDKYIPIDTLLGLIKLFWVPMLFVFWQSLQSQLDPIPILIEN